MASNKEKIHLQYGDGTKEDKRATLSRNSSLEFYYTKKHLEGMITKDSRVLEIGCATGHYGIYYSDKCKEYVGVDIMQSHIDIFNQKIAEKKLKNVSCMVGDATNLEGMAGESFDVVLCFGPMYHLPPEERALAFQEAARVCKNGGITAFAYINKIGVYIGACAYDEYSREIYPNENANKTVLNNGTDDLRPDTFFYTTPEDINSTAEKYGLTKIKNLATDFFIAMGIVNSMTEERFEIMRPLYDQMTSHESCTGMSNHALLICRKGTWQQHIQNTC